MLCKIQRLNFDIRVKVCVVERESLSGRGWVVVTVSGVRVAPPVYSAEQEEVTELLLSLPEPEESLPSPWAGARSSQQSAFSSATPAPALSGGN